MKASSMDQAAILCPKGYAQSISRRHQAIANRTAADAELFTSSTIYDLSGKAGWLESKRKNKYRARSGAGRNQIRENRK
jgi:hypothetical protein